MGIQAKESRLVVLADALAERYLVTMNGDHGKQAIYSIHNSKRVIFKGTFEECLRQFDI